jgi:protein subunit release factor B
VQGGAAATKRSIRGELFRIHTRYADTKRWKIEILDINDTGAAGGVKDVTFVVKGGRAYSRMKYEMRAVGLIASSVYRRRRPTGASINRSPRRCPRTTDRNPVIDIKDSDLRDRSPNRPLPTSSHPTGLGEPASRTFHQPWLSPVRMRSRYSKMLHRR